MVIECKFGIQWLNKNFVKKLQEGIFLQWETGEIQGLASGLRHANLEDSNWFQKADLKSWFANLELVLKLVSDTLISRWFKTRISCDRGSCRGKRRVRQTEKVQEAWWSPTDTGPCCRDAGTASGRSERQGV